LSKLRSKHNRLVREEETAAARLAQEEEERNRRDVVSRAVESESSVPHQPAPEADDIPPVPRFRRRVRRHEPNVAMEEDSDDGVIYLRYCLFCYQKHSVYEMDHRSPFLQKTKLDPICIMEVVMVFAVLQNIALRMTTSGLIILGRRILTC